MYISDIKYNLKKIYKKGCSSNLHMLFQFFIKKRELSALGITFFQFYVTFCWLSSMWVAIKACLTQKVKLAINDSIGPTGSSSNKAHLDFKFKSGQIWAYVLWKKLKSVINEVKTIGYIWLMRFLANYFITAVFSIFCLEHKNCSNKKLAQKHISLIFLECFEKSQ